MPLNGDIPEGFQPRLEAAKALGISPSYLDSVIGKLADPADVLMTHGRKFYRVDGVLRTWRASVAARKQARQAARLRAAGQEDPLLASGGPSPALERYRLARARIAELEAAKLEGRLLELDDVHRIHALMVSILRNNHERLRARFGEEAIAIVQDGFDAYKRQLRLSFGWIEEGDNDQR